jgi:DNA-binding NtrC family response regulator
MILQNGSTPEPVKFEAIVAESASMKAILTKARQLSRTGLRIVVQGPTGTGKEMVARAIHESGPRSRKPFFPINCGAIPENLAESELFGHEQGAFTGANRRKRGCFELAHEGILFLDEVTSLPHDIQVKLLRVLQDGRFLRMGGEEWVKVDVQLIVATNRDIRADVKAGRFREDLFYRLGSVLLEIPPLAERREDVPALLRHFLSQWSKKFGKALRGYSPAAWDFLTAYFWPGNVRQLELVVERLVAMEEGDEIDLAHFPAEILDRVSCPEGPPPSSMEAAVGATERRYILQVLRDAGWNRSEAARVLGISRPTLRSKIHQYGIVQEGAPQAPGVGFRRSRTPFGVVEE